MNVRPNQDAQIVFVEMVNRRSRVVTFGLLLVVLLLLVESTFEQTQARLSSSAEFTALLELRSSLGLRSKEWPIKSDPCWFWRGVQCRNGSVVGIDISGFRRTRLGSRNPEFAVDALANLTLLESFNASMFLLPGSIPDWFGERLSSLKVLDLRSCSIIGPIPSTDFRGLKNLQKMAIRKNSLAGSLPGNLFPALSQLQLVVLSQNAFTGNLPDVLWTMPNLSFLDVSGNNFTSVLPNFSFNGNATASVFNLSQNMFYGGLPSLPRRFSSIDMSQNYFEGRGGTSQRGNGVGPVPAGGSPPPPGMPINFSSLGEAFTYQQILQATGDFSDANFIKHGHSGDLYWGILEGGVRIVIKRIDLSSIKKETYLLELDFFSKVSHTRFVPLLGQCLENDNEKFLVYKYMPNGDLSNSLFRKTNLEDDGLQSLDWITRLKIAIGAAEALSHLHHECNPPLVHRDVQASSILLDDKFEVRLGSLSEVCSQEGDTHQNVITRFLRLPQTSEQGPSGSPSATCAYDVYCFGKVLLELVTGRLGISASNDAQVKEWLDQTLPCISIYDKELVQKIVDPSLIIDEDLLEEVWAMAIVARSCLNPKISRRPLMRYILKALENPLKVVREENSSSARLKTTSSRGSWNAALFGSWRHSSLDVAANPVAASTHRIEGTSSLKQSGTTGSQGSGQNGGGDHSSSQRRHSKEVFPEPSSMQNVERHDEN
ncbi:unnamed protein product, partial [Vitis vinifera]